MIEKLKPNNLTNATLFKRPGGKSWTLIKNTNQIVVHENNQATNWLKYIRACQIAGASGTGYLTRRYQRGQGIKGAQVFKPKQPILNPEIIADASKPAWIQKTK